MKTTLSTDSTYLPIYLCNFINSLYVIFINLIVRDSNHTDTDIFFIYYINAYIIINQSLYKFLYCFYFLKFITTIVEFFTLDYFFTSLKKKYV